MISDDGVAHPPLDCCGEDTCPYDYCALEADEMLESRDDLEDALDWLLDKAQIAEVTDAD